MSTSTNFQTYCDIFTPDDHTSISSTQQPAMDNNESFEQRTKFDTPRELGNRGPNNSLDVESERIPTQKCPVAYNLIDVGDASMESDIIHSRDSDVPSSRLCGYLRVHKPGDVNKFRRRWFVFAEENCRLLYFRTPQDMIPRCDIDVANSSFSMLVSEKTSHFTFEIRYFYYTVVFSNELCTSYKK